MLVEHGFAEACGNQIDELIACRMRARLASSKMRLGPGRPSAAPVMTTGRGNVLFRLNLERVQEHRRISGRVREMIAIARRPEEWWVRQGASGLVAMAARAAGVDIGILTRGPPQFRGLGPLHKGRTAPG